MALLLPLLALLVPLLITPGLLFHYDSAPGIIMLILGTAALLANPRQIGGAMARLRQQPAGRLLLALVAADVLWHVVASATSVHPGFSFFGSNWRRFGLLTVLALLFFTVLAAAHLFGDQSRIRSLLRLMTVVAIVGSSIGIAQYFDIDPFQLASAYHAKDGDSVIVRPPGTLGHADYFAWWLAIFLFCALGQAKTDSKRWRIAGYLAAVLCGAATILSGTRAAILAILLGFVSLAILSGFRGSKKNVASMAVITVTLLVFYRSPGGKYLQARVRWSSDESLGGGRPLLWRDALRMATVHPLTGFGPETFAAEFPRYQSLELARLLPDFYHESPHNVALDALIGEGIPGLAIAVGWIMLAGYAALLCLRRGSPLAPALISALVASAIASSFNVATAGPAFATLLVFAMLVALSAQPLADFQPPRIRRYLYLSPAIATGLAWFGLVLLNYELKLNTFERVSAGNVSSAAIASYASTTRTGLPGAGEDAYCSRRLVAICAKVPDVVGRIECLRVATRAAVRATSTSDDPANAWYNLAMFTAILNDEPNTEKALRTASRFAPNWFKPHWTLANLLARYGNYGEASSEAQKAVLLNGGRNPEVADALDKITRLR